MREGIFECRTTSRCVQRTCCSLHQCYILQNLSLSLSREDKRSPDFNGDRETMEYQGLDPDARGPFVFANGGSMMIRPV
jgi:hypothetical protein